MNKTLAQALKSDTVMVAIAQAIAGILVIILTEMGEMGGVLIVKSLADIILRYTTTKPVNEL